MATVNTTMKPIMDVKKIRQEAREHVEQGTKTSTYQLDRNVLVTNLNEALATEMVCYLRYKRHYFTAKGAKAEPIAEEFNVHALEELGHADQLAERIAQLGGEPDFDPATLLSRTHADYVEGNNLDEMIRENLIAERIAIDSYRELLNYIGEKDTTTKRLIESILSKEEEHADELSDWLPSK